MARGPAPGWSVHGSTVDSRWRGQRVRRHTHRSLASDLYRARKLTRGGAIERGERVELGGQLTEARAAVWRLGDGEETAAGREVGNRGARASGKGESELGRCGEVRGWCSPFLGAGGEGSEHRGGEFGNDRQWGLKGGGEQIAAVNLGYGRD
jgi:hypothetical protein